MSTPDVHTSRPSRRGAEVLISGDGLHVPRSWHGVFDVFFDGQRVWSFSTAGYGLGDGGGRLVKWPAALRPYLDGAARVVVREHLTARVVVDREHSFGNGSGGVRVVDAAGNQLAVGKRGHLERPFAAGSAGMVGSLLDQTSKILAVLREDCNLPAFISFGTLLGAVRDGRLIGHDSDADLAYLSTYEHPLDVIRELFRVERALRRRGLAVHRPTAGEIKVKYTGADGVRRGIDVFAGFMFEELLYLMPNLRTSLPHSAIVPLGQVTLEGKDFPAPADPPALLEATYGSGWRVPDPSFQFNPPIATRRRLTGWMRGLRMHRDYWEGFYRGKSGAAVPDEPSMFARWVDEHVPASTSLVDIGSGNGRDALWFARCGYDVLGLDYASPAVTQSRATAAAEGLSADFQVFNLYDLRQALTMGARFAATGGPRILYGRFLLHALEDEGRYNLWSLAKMALRSGGNLFLEFRTGKDAEAAHEFGEHFRRFLDPALVMDEIESRGGRVEYRHEGHGLAEYRGEDPHICRLVVGWQP